MKKILFVALATLVFTACAGRSGSSGSGGTDPLTVNCSQNEELVNGVCSCVSGYVADSNGDCVLDKLQLATPSMPATFIGASTFTIKFNTVKDGEGNTISGAKIHYKYQKMSSSATTTIGVCTALAATNVTCDSGTIIAPNTSASPILDKGAYCLKAIACADEYKPSALLIKAINVDLTNYSTTITATTDEVRAD